MFIRITKDNFMESLAKHKRFMWYIYLDDQDTNKYTLGIRPSWFDYGSNIVNEIEKNFPEVVFAESKFNEVYDILTEFNIRHSEMWDDNNESLKPFMISIDKGWIKRTSLGMCYCTETVVDMVHDIHPELFTK